MVRYDLIMTKIRTKKQLKKLNTLAVPARAEYFIQLNQTQDLMEVLKNNNFNFTHILGGGSNVLFKDDIDGLVIKNNLEGIKKIEENEDQIKIKVKSGENWDQFVRFCVKNNYWGIENLGLIPGSVGGAIIQNAGAYGAEIKDVVTKVEGINLDNHNHFSFSKQDCQFSYRDSIFKQKESLFVTLATFRLKKKGAPNLSYDSLKTVIENKDIAAPNIKNIYNTVVKIRKNKLPDWKQTPTAGSFFKNPFTERSKLEQIKKTYPDIPFFETNFGIKIPAGWLIEQIESEVEPLRGVDTYENHSLVIINRGAVSGEKIYEFSEKIRKKVKEEFEINLQREVEIW